MYVLILVRISDYLFFLIVNLQLERELGLCLSLNIVLRLRYVYCVLYDSRICFYVSYYLN